MRNGVIFRVISGAARPAACRNSRATDRAGKGYHIGPARLEEPQTTGAFNMLHLDEKKPAVAVANADLGRDDTGRQSLQPERARRTTDALRFRHRESISGLWNGREELTARLNPPPPCIPANTSYDSL